MMFISLCPFFMVSVASFIHHVSFFRLSCVVFFFFFFQAEDGIRDTSVTGVQTCALPIYGGLDRDGVAAGQVLIVGGRLAGDRVGQRRGPGGVGIPDRDLVDVALPGHRRSEERRVGKECRSRWSPEPEKEAVRTSAKGKRR